MNKNFKKSAATLLGTMVLAGGITVSHAFAIKATPLKINAPLSISALKLARNTYVSDIKNMDINHDRIKDTLILAGIKTDKTSYFFDKLSLIIKDGRSNTYSQEFLDKSTGGYSPELFLGDFDGNKLPEAFISMPTGGSGGITNYALFSLKDGIVKPMVNIEKFNAGIDLSGDFSDNYTAILKSKSLGKTIEMDLSGNMDAYQQNNIYTKDGKLIEASKISTYGFSSLKPVDKDNDGSYELEGVQRVVGYCNADTLGYLNSTWKMSKGVMKLDPTKVLLTHVYAMNNVDLNGDGVTEYYELTGDSSMSDPSIFVENISIRFYDNKTNTMKNIPVSAAKENSGYTPRLTLEDLNNDKLPEFIVSIPTGGSGGMETYSIISFKNKKPVYFLDDKFNQGIDYSVEFMDGYKVAVHEKENDKTYILDITDNKAIYNEMKIYDQDGKLLDKTSGMNNPPSYLEVKKVDGKILLVSYQRVVGTCNAETLGYLKATWRLDATKLILVEINVEK